MLRLLFFLTCSLTLLSAPAFSQVDFADLEEGTKKAKKVEIPDSLARAIDSANFDNAVYFKVGRSVPVGIYSRQPTLEKTAFDSFDGKDGTGAQPGFTAEIGIIYYFHKIHLPNRFRFGVDASLGYTQNKIVWANMPEGYKLDYTTFILAPIRNSSNVFVGTKIGPVLSYRLFDKLIADIFFKLNLVLVNAPEIYYYQARNISFGAQEWYSYQLTPPYYSLFTLQNSLGLNLRYSFFLAGLEYNYGRVGYSLNEQYGIWTPYRREDVTRTVKVSMPASKFLLTIGLKF